MALPSPRVDVYCCCNSMAVWLGVSWSGVGGVPKTGVITERGVVLLALRGGGVANELVAGQMGKEKGRGGGERIKPVERLRFQLLSQHTCFACVWS